MNFTKNKSQKFLSMAQKKVPRIIYHPRINITKINLIYDKITPHRIQKILKAPPTTQFALFNTPI